MNLYSNLFSVVVWLLYDLKAYFYFCIQEAEYGGHDQIDLYDDVISPSANNGDAPEDRDYMDTLPPTVGDDVGKGAAPNVVYTYTGKRIALYIGNLTWVSKLIWIGNWVWAILAVNFEVTKLIFLCACLCNEEEDNNSTFKTNSRSSSF